MKKMRTKTKTRSFKHVRRDRKKRRDRRKKGVSPVIGVILMVAATIVIAGVVMAMLGGFKAPTPTKTIGMSTSRVNSTHVVITISNIPPGVTIDGAGVSVDGGTVAAWSGSRTVGGTHTAAAAIGKHVVVNATFNDGSEQVILDTIV